MVRAMGAPRRPDLDQRHRLRGDRAEARGGLRAFNQCHTTRRNDCRSETHAQISHHGDSSEGRRAFCYDIFSLKTATLKNRPAQRACSTMYGAGFAMSSNWYHQRQ
jgi:hypothetical protein